MTYFSKLELLKQKLAASKNEAVSVCAHVVPTNIPENINASNAHTPDNSTPVRNPSDTGNTNPEQSGKASAPTNDDVPRKSNSKLGFELQEKVAALSEAILSRHPMMPILLREIHTTLRAYPENVTLASEEEIAIIVEGLKMQTGIEFAASVTKGSGQKEAIKKIKNLGVEAF